MCIRERSCHKPGFDVIMTKHSVGTVWAMENADIGLVKCPDVMFEKNRFGVKCRVKQLG